MVTCPSVKTIKDRVCVSQDTAKQIRNVLTGKTVVTIDSPEFPSIVKHQSR